MVRERFQFPIAIGCLAAACSLLTACGGGEAGNEAPMAVSQVATVDEDTVLTGQLAGIDPEGSALEYSLSVAQPDGSLKVDPAGAYTFTPQANFHGERSFSFGVWDGTAASQPATLRIVVNPVNDPPRIRKIEDLHNSAEVYALRVAIDPQDVDGDVEKFEAIASNPEIARMEFDASSAVLTLYPVAEGVARFEVAAADDQFRDSTSFTLTVGKVAKNMRVVRQSTGGVKTSCSRIGSTYRSASGSTSIRSSRQAPSTTSSLRSVQRPNRASTSRWRARSGAALPM